MWWMLRTQWRQLPPENNRRIIEEVMITCSRDNPASEKIYGEMLNWKIKNELVLQKHNVLKKWYDDFKFYLDIDRIGNILWTNSQSL